MKKLFIFIFNMMSMNAIAGYECNFQLAHTEDLMSTIATQQVQVGETLRSGSEGTLFVESEKKKKKVSLEVRSVMDGYEGSEGATFVVMRKITKKRNSEQERISETITLAGEESQRLWFDSYKLDIQCHIKK